MQKKKSSFENFESALYSTRISQTCLDLKDQNIVKIKEKASIYNFYTCMASKKY